MILTCPSCGTQYAIKDGAIPDGGRNVRCAACGHSWHQDSDAPVSEQEDLPETPVDAHDAEAPASEFDSPSDAPESSGEGPDEALSELPTPFPDASLPDLGGAEPEWDPQKELPDREELAAVANETEPDRKRNWLMAAIIAIVVVVLIVAALWLVAPSSLRQQFGLAAAGPTPLQIAPGRPERQKLASGNELVIVSGRVINPSAKTQTVPPIEAELRDKAGRLLYTWTISPPAPTIAPGGAAPFNSADMNAPPSGPESTVTLSLKG